MNEKKINQILRNQKSIMSIISVIHVNTRKDPRDSDIIKSLDKEYWKTIELLNPTKNGNEENKNQGNKRRPRRNE